MRTSHLLALVAFLFFVSVFSTSARGPQWTKLPGATANVTATNLISPETNSPPIATDDSYSLHGGGIIGPLLQNDSDPDDDPLHVQIETFPSEGQLFGLDGNSFSYGRNNPSFFGTDTFTYKACDTNNACSGVATVTVNTSNQAPVAVADSYTVHGGGIIGPMMANDFDPDGDPITWNLVNPPEHGTLFGLPNPNPGDLKSLSLEHGYTGQDSFTYEVCDQFGVCSAPATVTLTINNNPPLPSPDFYVVRGATIIGPLFDNDIEPDGDEFLGPYLTEGAQHGHVFGLTIFEPGDMKQYVPDAGYGGLDSWQYEIVDYLGASGKAWVLLFVLENDDAENAGLCSPCQKGGGAMAVGGPVNVTNGNMYLQQTDYQLPSVGPGLNVTRTFNSKLQKEGLFGRAWSTAYDSSLKIYDPTFIRLNLPDGRAVYYTRPNSSSAFTPVEKDFHNQLTQNGDGSFTLSVIDGGSQQFSAAGKLLSVADRYHNQTTLAYDGGGKLVSASDPLGRVLSFTTSASGQVLSISDSMGTIATYAYGPANQLLSTTYADNSAYHFSYDGSLQLTSVTDALGNILESHTYDSQGRALTSAKQGGVEHYTLNYVGDTQTEVTDALGHITRYTIDKSKGRNVVTRVESVCECNGNPPVQTWSYDDQLNVTSQTDALNHTTTFTYDAEGNRLTETDNTGTVTYTYNQFGEVLTRTNQLNDLSSNAYDADGNLVSSTNALGKSTTFTYNSRGLLLSSTNARGKTTSLAYDASGNLTKKIDALDHETQFAYDARGRLTSVTNALNHATTVAYDQVGRPTQLTRPNGTFITYEYDLGGRLVATTDAKGARSTYTYDGANRLTTETDPLSQTTSYSYDLMSNLSASTDATGRITKYEYDELDRLVKITYPPATTGATRLFESLRYNAASQVTQRTDTAGRTTYFAYTNAGLLDHTTDPDNQTTHFNYDPLGRMKALIDARGQRYRFTLDALGQLKHIKRGSGTEQMSFTYDAVGNRKQRTDYNGAVTSYDYDAVNRLKTINYPDTTSVSYTYDKLSRLQTATNENGAIDFDYNKMNRLTSVTDVFSQVIDYNYDDNGNRTKLGLNSATLATYRYDLLDRITKIIDSSSQNIVYGYDVTSKLISRKLPNGVLTNYQYDGLDRLTRLRNAKGANTVTDHQYEYNAASQITRITEPPNVRNYGYDIVDRLTSATYTNPAQSSENYAYDSVGNRTSSHLGATYTYQPFNRLASTSGVSYSYDANGNLTSKTDAGGTWAYSWDFENRLTQVLKPNGVSVSYKYDALGRRIRRIPSAGVSTNFVYDGQEVIKDLNSDGSTVDYLNGPGIDNKLRLTDSRLNTGPLYFAQDQLGSTTALTNSNGGTVAQVAYDAFGNSSGTSLTRYDYTGRERDPDTGLLYYRARWYDPQVGRFISEDPIGLAGGINQFAYVSNNPQNKKDPFGLYEIDVHYYLTYFLAMKTGCFTAAEARLIADADQGTDENESTAPGPGLTERQRQQNRDYHDLQPGNHEGQGSPALWQQAMKGSTNYVGLGQYLHHLQDSFSHAGYESDTFGHAGALHYYDKTASDVPKALRMAGATWKALNDYAEKKKCGCKGTWDASWWQQVVAFSKEHGANFDALETIDSNGELDNFGMTNNPAYLLRKIAILGLRPR
jgi:RHS repeat-associated protein